MKKGIGIFGLTANPFHNGHLQIIAEISKLPYIKRLDIVPTWNPPYKKCIDFKIREVMCCWAIFGKGLNNTIVRRFKVKYTYQLIKEYKKETDDPLYFFVGDDWDLTTFKNYDYIKENCILVPYGRVTNNEFSFKPISLPISSSMIRNMIKNNLSIDGLVPESINKYIKENKLYV